MTLLKWTKERPFWECPDEIDVAVFADVLAALYRFLPTEESLPIFQQCLEPEKSEAVKICVVKACLTLVVDVSPWWYSLLRGLSLCMCDRAGSFHGSARWSR